MVDVFVIPGNNVIENVADDQLNANAEEDTLGNYEVHSIGA